MKWITLAAAASLPALLFGFQDPTDEKIAKLEQKLEAKLDKAFTVYSGLSDLVGKMEKRLGTVENENRLLKIDIDRLTAKLAAVPVQKDPSVKDPAVKDPELAEASMKIDMALTKLKAGGSVEDAIKELVPLSRWSAAKMAEALGKNVTDVNFIRALEQVLAKCPAGDLKAPLGEAAKDRLRRASVARVIGTVGDRELSKILEVYIGESSHVQQVEIGKALLGCRNKLGVPPLLKSLKAPDSDTRFLAITYLRAVNQGESFNYDFNRTPDDNTAAIKRWDDWAEKEGKKLFD